MWGNIRILRCQAAGTLRCASSPSLHATGPRTKAVRPFLSVVLSRPVGYGADSLHRTFSSRSSGGDRSNPSFGDNRKRPVGGGRRSRRDDEDPVLKDFLGGSAAGRRKRSSKMMRPSTGKKEGSLQGPRTKDEKIERDDLFDPGLSAGGVDSGDDFWGESGGWDLGGMDGTEKDAEQVKEQERKELKEEMDKKIGRGWTDPWDLENMLKSNETYDDIPDWSPEHVSRVSQERVQIFPDKIPTLSALARLPLPPPPHPHPGHGHTKAYALHRNRTLYKEVLQKVTAMAEPRIPSIQAMDDWQDKQDAVDELFESVESELKAREEILGKHPKFGEWVERALEECLRSAQKRQQASDQTTKSNDSASGTVVTSGDESTSPAAPESSFPTGEEDAASVPIFMDCFGQGDSEESNVPQILRPLRPHDRAANNGRMLEEWELAAHKTTKRILLRHSTRAIARILEENTQARILVSGRQGVGKTAALASVVACARTSGHIVFYMPDCDQLHKNGFYIEPNEKRSGVYDLPILSERMCSDFVASHQDALAGFAADRGTLESFFTEQQLEKVPGAGNGEVSLADLVRLGSEKTALAPMCLSVAIEVLMKQDDKPFSMVLDEFNVFFQPGHYFHEHYDFDVKKPIPYDQISLFKPALDAMVLSADDDNDEEESRTPSVMNRGAVIVGTTESRAVARKTTDSLLSHAKHEASKQDSENVKLFSVEVPRLSNVEVDHVLSNYEATGVGRLRLDQGETVLNDQEVAYLRAISSNVPHKLMNACII